MTLERPKAENKKFLRLAMPMKGQVLGLVTSKVGRTSWLSRKA